LPSSSEAAHAVVSQSETSMLTSMQDPAAVGSSFGGMLGGQDAGRFTAMRRPAFMEGNFKGPQEMFVDRLRKVPAAAAPFRSDLAFARQFFEGKLIDQGSLPWSSMHQVASIESPSKGPPEMDVGLLKMPASAAPSGGAGGGESKITPPAVITIQVPSSSDSLASMAEKLFAGASPVKPQQSAVRPMPPPTLCSQAPPGLDLQADLGTFRDTFRIKPVLGSSKVAEKEFTGSTFDEGDYATTGSLPSDDDDDVHIPIFNGPTPPDGMTTLMIRNIPVMYTQEMLVLEWGQPGIYDFLYLPRKGQTNLSYAFINFVSEVDAMAFTTQWHKKRMAHFTARKSLNISFADVQGLKANIEQLKKRRLRQIRQCHPIIIMNGRQLDLAEALAIAERDISADTAALFSEGIGLATLP